MKKMATLLCMMRQLNPLLKTFSAKKVLLIFISLAVLFATRAQSVGIGTATPASSAQLHLESTTKGFLPPRMTFEQRNLIASPVAGLVLYCTDCDELQIYNGIIWKTMCGNAAAIPSGYPTVTICNQVWMAKNLAVSAYRNGDMIPQVTDPALWGTTTEGAWCWYNNDSANYSGFGKLYNWYAVNNPRGLAPQGWHVPGDAEWATLSSCLGGDYLAGGKLKETGITHWASPNTGATNSSGFTGLPNGYRGPDGLYRDYIFAGYWWSSSAISSGGTGYRLLDYLDMAIPSVSAVNTDGFSVRCVKD